MKEVFALSFQSYIFIVAIIILVLYTYLRSGPWRSRLQEGAYRKFIEECSQEKLSSGVKCTSPWLLPGIDVTRSKAVHSSSEPIPGASLGPAVSYHSRPYSRKTLGPEGASGGHAIAPPTVSCISWRCTGDGKLLQKIRSYSFSIINP